YRSWGGHKLQIHLSFSLWTSLLCKFCTHRRKSRPVLGNIQWQLPDPRICNKLSSDLSPPQKERPDDWNAISIFTSLSSILTRWSTMQVRLSRYAMMGVHSELRVSSAEHGLDSLQG